MTATLFYVAGAVLAGLGFLVAAALVFLFRRVASLQRANDALAEAIKGLANEPDAQGEPGDLPSLAAVYRPTPPRWQQESEFAPARHEKQQPAADLRPKGEGPRKLEAGSFDGAVAAYNSLAAHFSRAELQAFEQRWHPKSIARTPENWLTDDPQGDFWLIRDEGVGDACGLVVPGPEVVRKWELYYRSMGSMAAKNLLQGLYDIGDGAPLRLERPAIATRTDRGWKVDVPGAFADG